MEVDVIRAIANNEYSYQPGDKIWSWSITYNTEITNKHQVSGVVSSLVKKGLVETDGYVEDDHTVNLTENGIKVYKTLERNEKFY